MSKKRSFKKTFKASPEQIALERAKAKREALLDRVSARDKSSTLNAEILKNLALAIEEASSENDARFLLSALKALGAPETLIEKGKMRLYFIASERLSSESLFPSLGKKAKNPVLLLSEKKLTSKLPEKLFLSGIKEGFQLSLEKPTSKPSVLLSAEEALKWLSLNPSLEEA